MKAKKTKEHEGRGFILRFRLFFHSDDVCVSPTSSFVTDHIKQKNNFKNQNRNQIRSQISCQSWLIPSVPPPTLNAWIGQQFSVVRHLLLASP
jgi:hypothetical protein